MGTRTSLQVARAEFTTQLLANDSTDKRARLIAQRMLEIVADAAIVVYARHVDIGAWAARAVQGEAALQDASAPVESELLDHMADTRTTLQLRGDELVRESYAHVNVRRSVSSLVCVPLLLGDVVIGAIECLSFDAMVSDTQVAALEETAEIAAIALGVAL